MDRRRTRAFVVVAAAAALAGAIAIPASPAGATGGTSISVTPSTNLSDGDSVAVSVTGIPATASPQVYIEECNGDASLTYAQVLANHSCLYLAGGGVSNQAYSTSAKVVYGVFYPSGS